MNLPMPKYVGWITCALILASGMPAIAEPPSILQIFKKKQPLSDDSLELKAEHGPWMILAVTLSGEHAKDQAVAVASEIRRELKLPSFVLEKTIGASQTLGKGERIRTEDDGSVIPYELELRYANASQEHVYAVLVGEFNSIDDPRIEDALKSVRYAHPKALAASETSAAEERESAESSNWLVQKYRSLIWTRTDRKDDLGKMGAAFVTRNPRLPSDYFEAPKVDEFVASLNKQVEYSLLDCPGKFTVRVASFTGHAVTDFGNGSVASKLSETSDALERAALKANKLTTALRRQGEEAYQFHDRFGSYVMIGSFERIGQENSMREFQYNPRMLEVINKWCGYRVIDTQDPQTGAMGKTTSLKSLERIPFDIEGKPMAVPRASTSGLYRGSLLGSN